MRTYKLKELLSIKNGKDHKELKNGTIPIFGSGGIMRFGDKAIYNEESILLPRKGTLSNIQYVNKPFWTVDTIYYTIVNKGLANPFYLYNFIKSLDLSKLNTGTGVPSMTFDSYYNLDIILPELEVQQKIASVLSALDSKIELNNRINAELEAMAKTLYDYWFVQFDFPDKNGKPFKTSGGKMVWNGELKREIPEGWAVKLLGSEIEIQRGISYTSKEINGDGIPMISLNSFNLNGTYKPDGIKKYSGKYTDKNITKPGDLLIAATDVTRNADIIGRAILVPDYYSEDLVFSMDIAKIISKNIPSSFLMMLFNSNHYHNYIKWYASGTIVLHLNLDGTKRYNIEMPTKELLQKYNALYQPIAERIYKTAIENQKLTELRDWLLPMLMNGQVRVN
jgi:type I restriction enzyme S subunit